jgi:hypothetical protein
MVALPDSAKDALRGINQDLSNNLPYTSLLSSSNVATPLWVIPVAKSGDRIKEEPASSGCDLGFDPVCHQMFAYGT